MKKLISLKMQLLALLILISTFVIFNSNQDNNLDYISMGDGYSLGINSYGIVEYGYSDYLRDYLKSTNQLHSYTNKFSKSDMSIKMLKSNINLNKNNIKEYLQNADLLTLSIGLNDLKYYLSLSDNKDYKKLNEIVDITYNDYVDLINEIKKYYKNKIYVVNYPICNISDYYLDMGTRKLNDKIKNNPNIIYISTEIVEKNSNKYFSNPKNNYPNTLGYKAISQEIIENIEKNLKNI